MKHPFNILSVRELNNYINGIVPDSEIYSYVFTKKSAGIDAYFNGLFAGNLVISKDKNSNLIIFTYTKPSEEGTLDQFTVEFDGSNITKMNHNGEIKTSVESLRYIPDFYSPIIPTIDITNRDIRSAMKNGETIPVDLLNGTNSQRTIEQFCEEKTDTRKSYTYNVIDKDEYIKINNYTNLARTTDTLNTTQVIGDLSFGIYEENCNYEKFSRNMWGLTNYLSYLSTGEEKNTRYKINEIFVSKEIFCLVYHSHRKMIEAVLLRLQNRKESTRNTSK